MAGGQGCIVIREIGNTIVYKEKCERCGWVEAGEHHIGKPPAGAYLSTGFSCPKCRNHQDVRVYG